MNQARDESATLRRARARVGDTLNDKWKLERLLGVGGMGAVYAGVHRNGARAAVKVLHDLLARHEDVRSRFLREGYAANRVDHPSVVKVLDDDIVVGGPDSGTAYLVMELLAGESLEGRSHRGVPLSERDFLIVADVVLEVLEVAHRSGVVHRDIKPDNIFITREGAGRDRIKVLDFGLARLLEGQSSTVHGIAIGTPPFMSPEQAAGTNDAIDGRTDLFSLAASGFRLLTGRRIHEGASSVELVQKMGKLPAPRIRTVAPQVSEGVARILDRALEFRREDRYESAAAMRADVQRALAVIGTGWQGTIPLGGGAHDASIELSASDLESIRSLELSESEIEAVRSLEVGGSQVQSVDSIELSGRHLESIHAVAPVAPVVAPMRLLQPLAARAVMPATLPMVVATPLPPTEPMVTVDPVVTLPPAQPAAPRVPSDRPVAATPEPSGAAPSPAYGPPNPAYGPPGPVPGAPGPVYGPPRPVYGPPGPVYGPPAPAGVMPAAMGPHREALRPATPQRRTLLVRVLIAFAVVCVGAVLAVGWLVEDASSSSSTDTAPSATARPPTPKRPPDEHRTKPGRRPRH